MNKYNIVTFINENKRLYVYHEDIHSMEMEMEKVVKNFGCILMNMQKAMYYDEYVLKCHLGVKFVFKYNKNKDGYKITHVIKVSTDVMYNEIDYNI